MQKKQHDPRTCINSVPCGDCEAQDRPDYTILDAERAIKRLEDLQEERRNYEHENWHAVNVKRHGDGVSEQEVKMMAFKALPKARHYLVAPVVLDVMRQMEGGDGLWWHWIEQEREQLGYELSDIVALGMRDKPFSRLATIKWAGKRPVAFLGRSGGWACFQIEGEEYTINELTDALESYKEAKENPPIDPQEATLEDHRHTITEHYTEALEIIKEIEDVKDFIKKFNDGLDFAEEVKCRVEEKAEELSRGAYKLESAAAVYDTGEAGTIDRYTILCEGAAHGLAADPRTFNQYLGDAAKLHIPALGKKISYKKLPDAVKAALAERLS